MKKIFAILNALLILAVVLGDLYYMQFGSLPVKATVSSLFVLLGAVNLIYSIVARTPCRAYAVVMSVGLLFAMLGDVTLGYNFIIGAGLFALGHIFYFVAFCAVSHLRRGDLIPIAAMLIMSVLIIKCYPAFDFDPAVLEWVCLGYGVVISCMAGKAFSNLFRTRSLPAAIPAIGSALFYFSDLMLVLRYFADGPHLTDRLCLLTYYPAQALLAFSIFIYVNARAKVDK